MDVPVTICSATPGKISFLEMPLVLKRLPTFVLRGTQRCFKGSVKQDTNTASISMPLRDYLLLADIEPIVFKNGFIESVATY